MQLKPLIFLVASIGTVWGASVAQLVADLYAIAAQATGLENQITGFSGGSLLDALPIQTNFTNVRSAIDTATSDAMTVPAPLSEADGQGVLSAMQGYEPTVISTLHTVVAKKATIQALAIGDVVRQDLLDLSTSASNLGAVLAEIVSADLAAEAQSIESEIDAAFADAIAAFS